MQYCLGSQMYIADMLSRAYLQESGSNMTPDYEIFHEDSVFKDIEDINFMEYLRMSEATQAQIKQYT